MGDWYFLVGLVVAGATGYIGVKAEERLKVTPESQGLSVVVAFGMIALWLPVLIIGLGVLILLFGAFVGKILVKGSESIWPKLVAIWQTFD